MVQGILYMLGDHLGSTSVLLNQDGTVAKQVYYYPFGGNRGSAFSDITTKRFTGQYHEEGLPGGEGLSYYNARWYDAQLGRFISADTLVPSPANPQSLNRLTYVQNNPLGFTDPPGHSECGVGKYHCDVNKDVASAYKIDAVAKRYGVQFKADFGKIWTKMQKIVALAGVRDVTYALRKEAVFRGYRPEQVFKKVYGSLTFLRSAKVRDYGGHTYGRRIEFYGDAFSVSSLNLNFRYNVVHELGHAFNYVTKKKLRGDPYAALGNALGGALPSQDKVRRGMDPYPFQQNTRSTKNENYELFGDGFLNWTYNSFKGNGQGVRTSNWFNTQMSLWISPIFHDQIKIK